jgi:hypothetical protein|tara:strand:+ start:13033 stop:13503 length:471 start_codon:yes stop_codon:yes gene_type:complete
MGSVLHRTTKQLNTSAHVVDYSTDDWIRNPDLSSVSGVDSKYWKITGDVVSEMSVGEKSAVDTADARETKINTFISYAPIGQKINNTWAAENSIDAWTDQEQIDLLFTGTALAARVAIDCGCLKAGRKLASTLTPSGKLTAQLITNYLAEIDKYLP